VLWELSAGAVDLARSKKSSLKSKDLERSGVAGDTPVDVRRRLLKDFPSSTGPEKSRVNLAGPPAKPKYSLMTDSGQVP
jgi:hypothetical protein